MPTQRFGLVALSVFVLLAWNSAARAQWQTQSIHLEPGWNAVFLNVQPNPAAVEAVFGDPAIKSIWAWNRRFSPLQFVQDALTLIPGQPDWLTYLPSSEGVDFVTNLHTLEGGRPYLVHLGGSQEKDLALVGTPVTRAADWIADSWNLVGFQVDPAAPATFDGYLLPSPAHAGSQVFRLSADGRWEPIGDPRGEFIDPGEAYWVFTSGSSSYAGPIRVTLEQNDSLDFGRNLNEQVLRIRNETSAAYQLTLRPVASDAPPPLEASVAGPVLLGYWDGTTLSWVDFPASLDIPVGPREEVAVRLEARRSDFAPASSPGSAYQSLLEVVANVGAKVTVPVMARTQAAPIVQSGLGGPAPSAPRTGLWVGTASISQVSWAEDPVDTVTPKPASSEFQMRLIVHVDDLGQAKLLQHVTLMWKEGTLKPDPMDPTTMVVDEPGRFVLVTQDDLISQFSGSAVRDGDQVGRRISSAAFGFSSPVDMSGSLDTALQSGAITIDFDDQINPFKHRYHPDHDNLDFDFSTPLPEGREAYTVSRAVGLQFTSTDPDGLDLPGYGDTRIGGVYRETITGLHREDLHVQGTFRLTQASRVGVLDDGL